MKTNLTKQEQNGRSMVEMLGVLAVIGVLSVGGIAGYTTAMNKYKANEILDAASKRAILISSQLQGNSTAVPSLEDFETNEVQGVIFGTPTKLGETQFKIPLSGDGLTTEICSKIKSMVSDGSTGNVKIDSNCTRLLYNNDLSTNVTDTYNRKSDGSCNDAYQGIDCDNCAKNYVQYDGSNACELEPAGSECTESVGCQVTDGVGSAICNNGYCECTTGIWTSNTPTELNKGICTTSLTGDSGCTTNKDCNNGSEKGLYYCYFSTADAATGPTEKGTCVERSKEYGGTFTVDNHQYVGTYYNSEPFNWWSAKNFCAAYGKRMMTLSDYGCEGYSVCPSDSTYLKLRAACLAAKSNGTVSACPTSSWTASLTSDVTKAYGIHKAGGVNDGTNQGSKNNQYIRNLESDVYCR